MNDKTLTVIDDRPMDITAVKQHVTLIHQVMADVMKEGIDRHYGTIPGTQKPTLLQPGAQLVAMMFRLGPTYEIDLTSLGDGHREYSITCTLTHQHTGMVVGQGIGSANTMEDKWRYRWDSTGQTVPSDYWKTRDANILGGPQYVAKKKSGQWLIFQRVEQDNPASVYNTVLKIAKKRAFIDAVQTSTAASDVFTSGDELENGVVSHGFQDQQEEQPAEKPAPRPRRKSAAKDAPPPDTNGSTADGPTLATVEESINAASADDIQDALTLVNRMPTGTDKKKAFHLWQARKDALGV